MERPESWQRAAYDKKGKRSQRPPGIYPAFMETKHYTSPGSTGGLLYMHFPLSLKPPDRMVEIPVWPDLER